LLAEGLESEPTPLSPWGLRIDGRRAVTSGPAFQSGVVEIQDEGSQLVAALAGAGPEMRVVDYCAGAHNAERRLLGPGDKWAKRRAGSFDRVLVDAPCTGTGTWRRNPDARLRLRESDLLELLPKQASILDAAQGLVRKAGRLVYATCSLLPEENEAQVTAFLARHPGFSLIPAERAAALAPGLRGDDGFLSLTPAQHGTDGFFAAVMERVA